MSWLLEIDSGVCIGSGMCAGIAPEHFELEDGYGCPSKAQVEPADAVVDAAESCPVEAVSVRDSESGELVAPVD